MTKAAHIYAFLFALIAAAPIALANLHHVTQLAA